MTDLWRQPLKAVRARPLRGLVWHWVTAAQDVRMNEIMALYAADASLHLPVRDWQGLRDVRIGLLDSGALGDGWEGEARWSGKLLVLRRAGVGRVGWVTWLRVHDGAITEQWLQPVPCGALRFVERRARVVQ